MPNNETISAIASLWKLALALGIPFIFFLFRKPLQHAFMNMRNFRIKKGENEISMETSTSAASVETPSAEEKTQEPSEQVLIDEPTPKESGDLFSQMIEAFAKDQFEEAGQIFSRLQEIEEDPSEKIFLQAVYHYLMYKHGQDSNAVEKLEKLSEKEDTRRSALLWLARCHQRSGSYAKAIEAYARAISGDVADANRLDGTIRLAECHISMGNPKKGLEALTFALTQFAEPKPTAILYQGIGSVYEELGDSTLRAVALQKALEFAPENTSYLFSAAYSQSEANLPSLSASNYKTLLGFNSGDTIGLNNLGVLFDHLGLPMKSVSCYLQATENGNTLAMANLAYRYMNQGFEAHAQKLLDEARKKDDPDQAVGQAMSNLAQKKEEEDDAWDEIRAAGVKQKEYLWAFADAHFLASDDRQSFAGEWVSGSDKVFTITLEGDNVRAKWETEKAGEKFEGTVHNRSAMIKYQRKGTNMFSPTSWGAVQDGFAYVSEDGRLISLHTCEKRSTFFLELKKTDKSRETSS